MPDSNPQPLVTLQDVQDAVIANLPNLSQGSRYLLEDLVGKDRWHATQKGARSQLGQLYKEKVLAGEEPVYWVTCRSDNRQVYQLR